MMEEAMDESMDENEADMVDNPAEAEMAHVTGDAGDAKDKDEDCKCGDNVNKALINSLAACSQTLSTIEECKVGKVSSITSNKQVVPCMCEETLTTHLVKSVKSCTDAVETLTKCEKEEEKVQDSCALRYKNNPSLKSGTYELTINGKKQSVHCHMGERCGIKGGWMRVGYFDRRSQDKCPNDNFESHKLKNHYACTGIGMIGTYCASLPLETHGMAYSEVCGTAKAYQAGPTIGFKSKADINSPYLDGVSITRTVTGPEKRRHVFSLAAGEAEKSTSVHACPCNEGATHKPPAFVADDYFCESGKTNVYKGPPNPAIDDPLWDGKKFQYKEAKCKKQEMPWFKHSISPATSDQLELRLCNNKMLSTIFLESFDIYIR